MNKYVLNILVGTAIMGITTPSFGVELTADVNTRIEWDDDGNQDAEVFANFGVKMTDSVKANIVADLEELYDQYVADDFDWNKFVVGATVTIDLNQHGLPVYLVVGKHHRFELKANPSKLPAGLRDSLQENGSWMQQVTGVSAGITTSHFDELTVGVFADAEDGSFADDTIRFTARAVKSLNASMTVAGSIVYDMNDVGDDDWQASAALIFDLGTYTGIEGLEGWLEGTHYSDGLNGLSDNDFGVEFGLGYTKGKNTYSASVESLGSERLYRLGYARELNNGWTAGVEVSKRKSGEKKIKAIVAIPLNIR